MLIKRLLLTIIGFLAIIGLFMMPKVVVENEGGNSNLQNSQMSDSTTTPVQTGGGSGMNPLGKGPMAGSGPAHNTEISEEQRKAIAVLRDELKNSTNNAEKSITFADSLADLYQAANRYDSAAFYAGKVADSAPDADNLARAGKYYYNAFTLASDEEGTNNYAQKARAYFEKLRKKEPGNLNAKVKIAMTYVSSSTPMKGIQMLREVLEEDPQNESALFNLGLLSLRTGQVDKALERFERLVEINSDNLQGQFYLGVSYHQAGQTEKAKKQFDRVKNMSDNPMVEKSIDNYLKNIQ